MKIIVNAAVEASVLKTPSLEFGRLEKALSYIMVRYSDFQVRSNSILFDLKEKISHSSDETIAWCEHLVAQLNFVDGPVIVVSLIKQMVAKDDDLLFIAIQRKFADRIAWRVFVSELYTAYHSSVLPKIQNSYAQWMYSLSAYAKDPNVLDNYLDYWCRTVNKIRQNDGPLKLIKNVDLSLYQTHVISFEKKLLQKLNNIYSKNGIKIGLKDICLSAFLYAISEIFLQKQIPLMISETGRQHLYKAIDPARLIGNCQISFPEIFDMNSDLPFLNQVMIQKNSKPSSGLSYHALRLFHADNTLKDKLFLNQSPICFQYLGEYDQLDPHTNWRIDTDYPGWIGNSTEHSFGLSANFLISDERLHMYIEYQECFLDKTNLHMLSEKMYLYLENIVKKDEVAAISTQYFVDDSMHRRCVKSYEPFLILNNENINSTPIVFLPPGGGGAESYLNILQVMHVQERIILFNNYLRDSGDLTNLPDSFESLASICCDHLLGQGISNGVRLAGYSFGGVLDFEMANQLESRGVSVKDLYLIDPVFVGDFVNDQELMMYQKLRRDIEFIAHYQANKKHFPNANVHFFKSIKPVFFGENPDINEQKIIHALNEPLNGLALPEEVTWKTHYIDADHYQLLSTPFIQQIMLSIFDRQ